VACRRGSAPGGADEAGRGLSSLEAVAEPLLVVQQVKNAVTLKRFLWCSIDHDYNAAMVREDEDRATL
jgi:hypothetical protein